ncbi:serine protease [Ornithinimicrobium sp. LYQ121]|uniref:S1 family peptidase n=1 Tax=Ornithinimicrobium sp. LYQ121 TaxID=3378801 RepID=UPI00385479E7
MRLTTEAGKRGTGFIVDYSNGKAIVTAKHLCNGEREEVLHFHQAWGSHAPTTGLLDRVGPLDAPGDVAAFDLPESLWPEWYGGRVPTSSSGLIVSQDCFILGYPYDLSTELGSGQEAPLVKKGILAGGLSAGGVATWCIDIHANPGFSGGPLICPLPGKNGSFVYAGVVIGSMLVPAVEPKEQQPEPLLIPSGLSQCVDVKALGVLGITETV